MFGRGIACHAEQDHCTGPGCGDRDFYEGAPRCLSQHFLAAHFAPVAGIWRRGNRLRPIQAAPDAARQIKAIAACVQNAGLMYMWRVRSELWRCNAYLCISRFAAGRIAIGAAAFG